VSDHENDANGADGEAGRNGEFRLYEDSGGEWRWRLVADNSEIIADSGEGYASKYGARNAARSIKEKAPSAPLVILSDDGVSDDGADEQQDTENSEGGEL
jgi:uncharacterized protein YegP (UPF0339 family)